MSAPMDHIALVAQDYFDRHGAHAFTLIDDQISRAIGQHEWDEALKWYRVRHRLRRLQVMYAGGKAMRPAH